MPTPEKLAAAFEDHRAHLRSVAYRMLGSLSEADDAVQEAWLRLARADSAGIANLRGWLTTAVARLCLDALRARRSRREEPAGAHLPEPTTDPGDETAMADAVGRAVLVVLHTLAPAERLAFVLHDMFAMPFDEIAAIVGRSPAATRQLASRARRRVHGAPAASDAELAEQRTVVSAFLAALRGGDLEALVAVLDPDVVIHADAAAGSPAGDEVRGARPWAQQTIAAAKGARAARTALVDGEIGVVVAPGGTVFRVLKFTLADGKIADVELIGDPARLAGLTVIELA